MSYLDSLRLHFAGRFQAAPSTVNNDVTHYNNATFQASYQELATGTALNGWWNPEGGAEWRLLGCTVTSAWYVPDEREGSVLVGDDDVVLNCLVADADRRPPAKIVDLDPLQQGVSGIWGMEVRICTPDGRQLLRGQFEPVGFFGLWPRVPNGPGGIGAMSSAYQSVLTDLEWANDLTGSPFMQALQKSATEGLLSIKFNVDAYQGKFGQPHFTTGRITGTIGPYRAHEPHFFVAGRQFVYGGTSNQSGMNTTLGGCTARLDEQARRIFVDLGNALPVAAVAAPAGPSAAAAGGTAPALVNAVLGGPFANQGVLQLVVPGSNPAAPPQPIGDPIDYLADHWYATTAGVAMLPLDRNLTDDELAAIKQNPLALQLTTQDASGNPVAQLTNETPDGLYVRADQFVFRVDANQSIDVRLLVTQYGQPLPATTIWLAQDLGPWLPQLPPPAPVAGLPAAAVTLPNQASAAQESGTQTQPPQGIVVTGPDGWATATISLGDPGKIRGYIDGQVYAVRPYLALPNNSQPPSLISFDSDNFVSILLWDTFEPEQPVTWYGSLQPIFQQYANLYPVMSRFLNLADPLAVWKYRELLHMAFSLPITNPNTMPVTRDLSTPKRQAILAWLKPPTDPDLMLLGQPAQTESKDTLLPLTLAHPPTTAAVEAGPYDGKLAVVARQMKSGRPR